ncbi:MAG: nucleotidyltransferase family protein, partial [Clostridia bacterium]|nr:nucleotidyltransferase family protein [Clostridia bacterium]
MTDTEKLFISVLRDFVKGRSTEISVKSNNEYSEALELAKKHSLRAMYEYVISDNKGDVNVYIALSVQRIFAAEQLLSEIEKRGIKLCVMKGFLIREYYPVPELRSFGDIDFLIEESSAETIIQLMSELGYERTPGEDHVMSFKKDKEYYEFHTKLIEKGVFNDETYKTASFAWDYTVPYNDYKNIFEFTREFHLFYTVLHIAKHFRSMGAGVRMILDVAVLTDRAADIDWTKL